MVLPALIPIATTLATTLAPTLIKELAGEKAGEVAQKVADVAMAVTGASGPDEALRKIQGDPELEHKARLALAEIELEYERIRQQDLKSARDRDVAMRRAGYRNWRADLMVVVAFAVLALIVGAVWDTYTTTPDKELPSELLTFLSMIAGAVLAMLKDAYSFEFGSSRSSKEKTEFLKKQS